MYSRSAGRTLCRPCRQRPQRDPTMIGVTVTIGLTCPPTPTSLLLLHNGSSRQRATAKRSGRHHARGRKHRNPSRTFRSGCVWGDRYDELGTESYGDALQYRDRRHCTAGLQPRQGGLSHAGADCDLALRQSQSDTAFPNRLADQECAACFVVSLAVLATTAPLARDLLVGAVVVTHLNVLLVRRCHARCRGWLHKFSALVRHVRLRPSQRYESCEIQRARPRGGAGASQ